DHSDCGLQALLRASRVDDPAVLGLGQIVAANFGCHSGTRRDLQLFRMAPELMNPVSVGLKHLCDQKSELAIAEHRDRRATGHRYLIENFAGRCKRLGEDSEFSWNRIGHYMQVPLRQSQELTESAGMAHDTEHSPVRAMPLHAAPAHRAAIAREVDFADDAPADELVRIGLDDFANELVSRHARKSVVSALKLQVRIADAATQQTYERETLGALRARTFPQFDATRFEMDGLHVVSMSAPSYRSGFRAGGTQSD